jgi:hypothetical protein
MDSGAQMSSGSDLMALPPAFFYVGFIPRLKRQAMFPPKTKAVGVPFHRGPTKSQADPLWYRKN